MKNVTTVTVSETPSDLFPMAFVLLGKTQTHLKRQIHNEKWGNHVKRETINVTKRLEGPTNSNNIC